MNQLKFFYNRCIERYGYKTYLFVQQSENSDNYNINPLDNSEPQRIINRSEFFTIIPSLLSKKYTVIIINYINSDTIDITAVHQPEQKQLNLPPLFI